MTTIHPTAEEFDAMLAELRDAMRAGIADPDPTSPVHERFKLAYAAIQNARPTDPAVLAQQVRWLIGEQDAGVNEDDRAILEHVADQLEALALRMRADTSGPLSAAGAARP